MFPFLFPVLVYDSSVIFLVCNRARTALRHQHYKCTDPAVSDISALKIHCDNSRKCFMPWHEILFSLCNYIPQLLTVIWEYVCQSS